MFKERLLKEALRVYAGQHVLDRVLALGEKALELDNGRERMAVLYVMASVNRKVFEAATPAEALREKTRFFTVTQEEVRRAGGRIADYLGDDAVAYFPPRAGEAASAGAAVECARKIVGRCLEGDAPPLVMPMIGIDFGMVYIGNFGTPERMKFTVQGETVNRAFEIAACCRKFQATVLMSGAMAGLLATPEEASESYVGEAPVKGDMKGEAGAVKLYVPMETDFGSLLSAQINAG
ncbi:MAG: adenylate/guanylate cyclase with integral rane sensor [Betaproteobacteria bacterium]|nr:adenylate/guanylate cyclase with integral rane sensor [Betaproteobacteria bacterium]